MKLYVIDYYVNGIVKETINYNNPINRSIAKWKVNNLAKTTHKSGKLILRSI